MVGYDRLGDFIKDTDTFIKQDDGEKSFDELAEMLSLYTKSNLKLATRIPDPATHVKSQFKEAIAQVIDVMKDKTFKTGGGENVKTEDSFELFAADFMIDYNLNVWWTDLHQEVKMNGEYDTEY